VLVRVSAGTCGVSDKPYSEKRKQMTSNSIQPLYMDVLEIQSDNTSSVATFVSKRGGLYDLIEEFEKFYDEFEIPADEEGEEFDDVAKRWNTNIQCEKAAFVKAINRRILDALLSKQLADQPFEWIISIDNCTDTALRIRNH
jgi:hypothetical protein